MKVYFISNACKCVAVNSIPEVSKASTSHDDSNKDLLRNVRSLLQDVSKLPLLGISEEVFRARLQEWLAAEQAHMQAARMSHIRLQQFLGSLTDTTIEFPGAYIDDLILAVTKM